MSNSLKSVLKGTVDYSASIATILDRLLNIFSAGRNGALYVPSDITSLYQDSARTTPVTAVTQPVGSQSDKSGNTHYAIQATAAARPTWTNRVNLLTYTEQFDNASWIKTSATITANSVISPDGTLTADLIYPASSGTYRGTYQTIPGIVSAAYTTSFYAKANGFSWVGVVSVLTGADGVVWFDLTNGVVGQVVAGNTATISSVGNGWYKCTVAFPAAAAFLQVFVANADGSSTSTANGTNGIYIWGAQLEVGSTATTYQRVTTATDFNTVGFPYYLSFLGTDDCLTSATGGGGSAGFFWCGAVLPTGGAATLRTIFADNGTNTGYKVQLDTANKLSFSAGDNTAFTTKVSTATVNVGTKYMLTVWDDGTNLNVQIDSAAAETVARPVVVAGTAGYTIGKDNGAASSFFIGYDYASVYWKDTAGTASERATAQAYVKAQAGL